MPAKDCQPATCLACVTFREQHRSVTRIVGGGVMKLFSCLLAQAGLILVLFAIPVAHAAPPANDSIENAELIPPGGDGVDVLFESATSSASDPSCGGPVYQSVWYRYTPLADDFVVAELSGFLSEPRPRVSVWAGSPGALAQAQCHPDADAAELAVQAGVTYYFQVYQASPAPQNGSLFFSVLPLTYFDPPAPQPPVNDLFWFAPTKTTAFNETADIGAAVAGVYDPPNCAGSYLSNSLWYRFVPSVSGSYDAVVDYQADYEVPYAAVFTGPGTLDELQPYTCSKQGESKPGGTRFTATAGTPYYIQFAAESNYEESIPASVLLRPTPPVTAGSANVSPNAGYSRSVVFIEVLFVTVHMPVDVSFTCAAAIADPVSLTVTVVQGAYTATGYGSGSCSTGSGRATVDVVYRGNDLQGFHRGAAVATATVANFDANYDVDSGPKAVVLGGQ